MTALIDFVTHLSFEWPWAILLCPVPWLLKDRPAQVQLEQPGLIIPLYQRAQSLALTRQAKRGQSSRLQDILALIAWLALILACMRPIYVGESITLPLSGRDVMLAVDISPSMEEQDLQLKGEPATRLNVVKSVVADFVEARDGDRVGLILFGSRPYIQAPLSFDLSTVNQLLQEAFLGMAGQATAIGDAIALGVKRLRQRPEQSRVLILLSDGANTAGEIPPEKAAQLAAQEQIKIYTIGIGADEMLKRSFFGSRRVNPSADLDERMLRDIASTSGGEYFRARSTEELEKIYQAISSLEPVEQEQRQYRPSTAYYYYCLSLALMLYLLRLTLPPLHSLAARVMTSGARK